MADITLTGKIYNEANELTSCSYSGFAYPYNKWNIEKNTSFNEYSINLGDGDWLTSDTTVSVGDVVLLKFVSQNDGIALIRHILTQDDISSRLIVCDIKLLNIQPPSCSLSVATQSTINSIVTASLQTSDEYQWDFNGKTHYHKYDWYGTIIFDNIGILTREYEFDVGFQSSGSYTYYNIGDYIVTAKSTNKNGQVSTCQKPIRIKYNTPIGCINTIPIEPILDDIINITSCIEDADNRITKISHVFDGFLVEENNNIAFTYTKTLNTFKQYIASQIIVWNDGFSEQTLNYEKQINIQNQIPIAFFTYNSKKQNYTFTPNCSDIDGEVTEVKWQIYFELPFSKTEVLVYDSGYIAEDNHILSFSHNGNYRVVLNAKDNIGAVGTYSKNIEVELCVGAIVTSGIDVCEIEIFEIEELEFNIEEKEELVLSFNDKEIIDINIIEVENTKLDLSE